jgi:hypothetical protein
MAWIGEVIKQDFKLIPVDQTAGTDDVDIPDATLRCCFIWTVYASLASTDSDKNDFRSFLKRYNDGVTGVDMWLQKDVNGTFVDQTQLTDDTYGTYYGFGFETRDNESLVGYKLNWRDVLAFDGIGIYRIRFDVTKVDTTQVDQFSDEYCLKNYHSISVDKSLRFEFTNNSIIGDPFDQTRIQDFTALNWVDQIRIPLGTLTGETSTFEQESVKYSNGNQVDVTQKQDPTYQLIIGKLPYTVHQFIKSNVMQADEILITDYTSQNPIRPVVDRSVKLTGNYEPNWTDQAQLVGVTTEMTNRFNRYDKKSC